MDLERACAQLIGNCLQGMMIGHKETKQEKAVSHWLEKPLFFNGLQLKYEDIGMRKYVYYNLKYI